MRDYLVALLQEVEEKLDPLQLRGLMLPPFRHVRRPAVAFDTRMVPHGLVEVGVADSGGCRCTVLELLRDCATSPSTFLLDYNENVDPRYSASVEWVQRHLHMVLWLPNTRTQRPLRTFPPYPQSQGGLLYIHYRSIGVLLGFWEPMDGSSISGLSTRDSTSDVSGHSTPDSTSDSDLEDA